MTPLRITIVEDDAMLAAILAELLAAMGHRVCAIEDTASGVAEAAMRAKPDLILIDILLAQGDGPAAMAAMAAMAAIALVAPVPHVYKTGGAFTTADLPQDAPGARRPRS